MNGPHFCPFHDQSVRIHYVQTISSVHLTCMMSSSDRQYCHSRSSYSPEDDSSSVESDEMMTFESAADYASRLQSVTAATNYAGDDESITTGTLSRNDVSPPASPYSSMRDGDAISMVARWDENESHYCDDDEDSTTSSDDESTIDHEYLAQHQQQRMQTTNYSSQQLPRSSNTGGDPPVPAVVPAQLNNSTNHVDDIENPFDHPLENPEYTHARRPPATTPGAIAVVRRGHEEQDLEDDQIWDPTAPVDFEQPNPSTNRSARTFIDADVTVVRRTWYGMSARQAILVATLTFLIIAGAAAGIAVSVLKSKDDDEPPASKQDDCDFSNVAQPNPIIQCACNGQITMLTDGLLLNYNELKQSFVPSVLSSFEYPADSCEPQNAALLWLATDAAQGLSPESMRNRYLLSLMYAYWNGINWLQSDGWLSSESECSWHGINCTDAVLVDDINLYDNNVNGKLFTELGLFQNLVGLFVDQNSLKGSIPVEITDASLLEFLAFDGNDIEGSIPSEIGLLDLKEFTAAANRLTGSIPTEIVECSNLDFVLLDDNLLTGTIPARMGTLTRLAYLHLSVNDELQGVIPPTIGLLSNLVSFESSQTQLTGTIPIDLMSLTTLTSLSLGFNNFESAPLGSKVSQLRNLESLLLPETSLISSIPSEVGLLTNLVELHLYSNGLTGEIPVELGSLEKAEQILLHVNELEGTVPEQVCDLPELEAISVSCGLSVGPECDCCVECANI